MKNTFLNTILAATALTLSGAAVAQTSAPAEAASSITSDGQGLIGQTYAGLTYSYINLDGTSTHADSYGFQYNQALNTGLDGRLTYNYAQSGEFFGSRLKQQDLGVALRAFSHAFTWAKPYVEGGAGYVWQKYAGAKDNSFFWRAEVGAEFQLAAAFTLTPFVEYADAPDLNSEGTWNYGAKGNYWVNSEWAVTVGVSRDDDKNSTYILGTNFRF